MLNLKDPWLREGPGRSLGHRQSKGKIEGASRMQTFQPPALSGSRGAFVMPVFMIAVAVAAFWFAAVMLAIACSVVVLSAFSASVFVLALSRSMIVFAAVVALSDLQFWIILLSIVEAAVDINALFDTAICGVGVGCEDNN